MNILMNKRIDQNVLLGQPLKCCAALRRSIRYGDLHGRICLDPLCKGNVQRRAHYIMSCTKGELRCSDMNRHPRGQPDDLL